MHAHVAHRWHAGCVDRHDARDKPARSDQMSASSRAPSRRSNTMFVALCWASALLAAGLHLAMRCPPLHSPAKRLQVALHSLCGPMSCHRPSLSLRLGTTARTFPSTRHRYSRNRHSRYATALLAELLTHPSFRWSSSSLSCDSPYFLCPVWPRPVYLSHAARCTQSLV